MIAVESKVDVCSERERQAARCGKAMIHLPSSSGKRGRIVVAEYSQHAIQLRAPLVL